MTLSSVLGVLLVVVLAVAWYCRRFLMLCFRQRVWLLGMGRTILHVSGGYRSLLACLCRCGWVACRVMWFYLQVGLQSVMSRWCQTSQSVWVATFDLAAPDALFWNSFKVTSALGAWRSLMRSFELSSQLEVFFDAQRQRYDMVAWFMAPRWRQRVRVPVHLSSISVSEHAGQQWSCLLDRLQVSAAAVDAMRALRLHLLTRPQLVARARATGLPVHAAALVLAYECAIMNLYSDACGHQGPAREAARAQSTVTANGGDDDNDEDDLYS